METIRLIRALKSACFMTAAQVEEKSGKILKKVCGKQSREMMDGLAAVFPSTAK
ncbi:MAG: hypothetical protein SPG48_02520 [Treponema sp.]|nr:hypothetical protein [Treponema sp.]